MVRSRQGSQAKYPRSRWGRHRGTCSRSGVSIIDVASTFTWPLTVPSVDDGENRGKTVEYEDDFRCRHSFADSPKNCRELAKIQTRHVPGEPNDDINRDLYSVLRRGNMDVGIQRPPAIILLIKLHPFIVQARSRYVPCIPAQKSVPARVTESFKSLPKSCTMLMLCRLRMKIPSSDIGRPSHS